MAVTPWPPAAQMETSPRPGALPLREEPRQGRDDPRPGGGEGVARRERGPRRVEPVPVDRPERPVEAEPLRAVRLVLPRGERGQHLGGERLVDLVEVEVAQGETGAGEHARYGVGGRHQQPLLPGHVVDGGGLVRRQVRQRGQPAPRAHSSLASRTSAAPSVSGVELPAVMVPSGPPYTGLSAASF